MARVAQRDGCAQDTLARAQGVLRSLGWVDWVAMSPTGQRALAALQRVRTHQPAQHMALPQTKLTSSAVMLASMASCIPTAGQGTERTALPPAVTSCCGPC